MRSVQQLLSKTSTHISQLILATFISIMMLSCNTGSKSESDSPSTPPSLAKSFENKFSIGVAFSPKSMNDSMDRSVMLEHFNSITSENEMKWERIHPEPGVYDFEESDKFVEFGETNNMYIVGHVLVWHSQTPSWVFETQFGERLTREGLLARMRDHIHTVVGRYKGRVHCWDVVNEALTDEGMRQSSWHNIIGDDYVEKAFQFAHEADPDAILVYNDYSVPTPAKRENIIGLTTAINATGIPVHGIGMQGHYHLDYPDLQELDEAIDAFAKQGLKVMITEMDINILPRPDTVQASADIAQNFAYEEKWNPYANELPDSMQIVLAERYRSFFEIFVKYSDAVDRVTFWGIQDGGSWLNNWPIRGRTNYPLLFDRNYQPKEAFWSVTDIVKSE